MRLFRSSKERNQRCAASALAALTAAMLLPGPSVAADPVTDEAVSAAVAHRAAFGFGGGENKARTLLEEGSDPASAQYGFPVSKAEAQDLEDRARFANRVSRQTLPYAKTLKQYGGAWIDQEDGGSLVVVLTTDSDEIRGAIRAKMPEESLGLRFQVADDTWDELAAAVSDSPRAWAELASGVSPFAFGTDEQHNQVVARVIPSEVEAARKSIPALERELGVDVAVEGRTPPVDQVTWSATGGRHNYYGPFKLGVKIRYTLDPWDEAYVCSMGFHAIHPTNNTLDETFMTAGHCVYNRPDPWNYSSGYHDAYGNIGARVSSKYTSKNRDIALVKIDDWAQNRTKSVYDETAGRTMEQPDYPTQGETLCMSLGNQDVIFCGTADATHQQWKSTTANIWVWGSGVDLCCGRSSIGGDSGSPIYRRWGMQSPPLTQHITPIGILDAGNETPAFDEDHDIYFARVIFATDNADGWPGLEIFDGPNGVGGP